MIRSRGARLVAGSLTVLLLAVVVTTAPAFGTFLVTSSGPKSPDAILMLASHEWERLPAVSRVARENPGATVLLTEPRRPTIFNCHLCAERSRWLVNLGVESTRIVVLQRRVGNTHDEAEAAREYSSAQGVHRLLVVTSPYHTRRTLAVFTTVFRDSGVEIGVQPALPESPARPEAWWMSAYDRAYVRYEWAALVWYAIRHQVSPFAGNPH